METPAIAGDDPAQAQAHHMRNDSTFTSASTTTFRSAFADPEQSGTDEDVRGSIGVDEEVHDGKEQAEVIQADSSRSVTPTALSARVLSSPTPAYDPDTRSSSPLPHYIPSKVPTPRQHDVGASRKQARALSGWGAVGNVAGSSGRTLGSARSSSALGYAFSGGSRSGTPVPGMEGKGLQEGYRSMSPTSDPNQGLETLLPPIARSSQGASSSAESSRSPSRASRSAPTWHPLSRALDDCSDDHSMHTIKHTPPRTSARDVTEEVGSPSKSAWYKTKRGAGRSAWGADVQEHAILGAGVYEDDDDGADEQVEAAYTPASSLQASAGSPRRSAASRILGLASGLRKRSAHPASALSPTLAHERRSEPTDATDDPEQLGSSSEFRISEHDASKQHSPSVPAPSSFSRRPAFLHASSSFATDLGAEASIRQPSHHSRTELLGGQISEEAARGGSVQLLFPQSTVGRGRFNSFKRSLIVANAVLSAYSIVLLVVLILLWGQAWKDGDVVLATNHSAIALGTAAMCMSSLAALIGWFGILLNNRLFLSIYNFLLWPSLALIAAPAYLTYRKREFNLEGKVNQLWSRQLSTAQRLLIQHAFDCCGYFGPFVLAAADGERCFSRSAKDGCKADLLRFEREALRLVYTVAFAISGVHILVITTAILCSDHVTYTFGKGTTPAMYDPTVRPALDTRPDSTAGAVSTSFSRRRSSRLTFKLLFRMFK